jgi:hypothetical protein
MMKTRARTIDAEAELYSWASAAATRSHGLIAPPFPTLFTCLTFGGQSRNPQWSALLALEPIDLRPVGYLLWPLVIARLVNSLL